MKKKIAIAVGGSGGHIFPAQTLALQLLKMNSECDILFLGAGLSKNPFFKCDSFSYNEVPSGSFSFAHPLRSLKASFSILQGCLDSRKLLSDFSPDLVVGFGSYHTLPILLGAKFQRLPILLFAADSIPGRVVRLFSPFSLMTAIYFPEAAHYLRGKSKEVALPMKMRSESFHDSKEQCRQYFCLEPHRSTLLVFGGSQGAKIMNNRVSEILTHCSLNESWQIIHITGDNEVTPVVTALYAKHNIPCCVKSFEDKMYFAWRAADCVIGRAGASSIAEQIEFEVPGILIPYPYAMDDHQKKNAQFLADEVGGGTVVLESELPSKLATSVHQMISTDANVLCHWKSAIADYKKKNKRPELAELVLDVLGV